MSELWRFKSRLHGAEISVGSWITYTDPCVTETMCQAGFDFLIIDAEHGPVDLETIMMHLMVCERRTATPIVRIPWNDQVIIKRILDMGAAGVLVPLVRTAADVRQAIKACMYPPDGIRGFGPRRPAAYERFFKEYIAVANQSVIVIAQIEHIDAVNSVDEILSVAGLDGVLVGPCDLSGSMGLLGQTGHLEVLAAIDRVISAGQRANVPVGLAGPRSPEAAYEWIRKGMRFITVGSDMGFLTGTADRAAAEMRRLVRGGRSAKPEGR